MAILETPEDTQPVAVRKNRRDIERAMRYWVPPLSSPEEALAKLRSGTVTSQEAMALLRKIPKEAQASLDLDSLIGPLIQKGRLAGRSGSLAQIDLDAGTRATLDRRIQTAAQEGKLHEWAVREYLAGTGRGQWTHARGFIEDSMSMGGKAPDVMVSTAMRLRPGPDKDWYTWAMERYALSAHVKKMVEARTK